MQALDFLDKLLRYDHQDRLTAREAMVIPFLVCQLDYYFFFFPFSFWKCVVQKMGGDIFHPVFPSSMLNYLQWEGRVCTKCLC